MLNQKVIELLNSDDYKKRFTGEYTELYERTCRLKNMLVKWELNELKFQPKTPYPTLKNQYIVMQTYLRLLEQRAEHEFIVLPEFIGEPYE